MTICCLGKRKLKNVTFSESAEISRWGSGLFCWNDVPKRFFKLGTSESRVKNIHFTVSKNRGYFFLNQVDELFECLNKTVDVIYQYCSHTSKVFCRTYYPYIKFVFGNSL